MTKKEAIKLLRGGPKGVAEWNRRRETAAPIPNLSGANLSDAVLIYALLDGADLSHADLSNANLHDAFLADANLSSANLSDAVLTYTNLTNANLSGANLSDTNFAFANLSHANLFNADLSGALLLFCVIGDVDLSVARGLTCVRQHGPSIVSTGTLVRSKGKIPDGFLRGCGLQPWEITNAKIYNPDLTALEVADLQAEAFRQRTEGPIFIGGVFISYAREDSSFVDKLRDSLREKGVPVWVDRHDAPAGPTRRIVVDAIRLNDVMLLVLSKNSVSSKWVDYELKKALQKEVDEGREVLCPVTLDDAWHARTREGHWREVREKNVLDFAKWKTKAFDAPFAKLLKGLKIYYAPKSQAGDQDAGGAT